MNATRILFPTDFSASNYPALVFASNLARDTGAPLYIVHVDELFDIVGPSLPTIDGGSEYVSPWDGSRQRVREMLNKITPTVAEVRFERHYLVGTPVKEILWFAGAHQIDLIVMASHGRTGLSRLLMGSVAEGVMRDAECPVLIVKQPAKVSEESKSTALAEPHN
jgi:universal stress protein A